MDKVIATIDVSTPTGRKIVRELENHKKTVHIEYPLPEGTENAPTHKEVFSKLIDKLSEHYDTDMHKIVKL